MITITIYIGTLIALSNESDYFRACQKGQSHLTSINQTALSLEVLALRYCQLFRLVPYDHKCKGSVVRETGLELPDCSQNHKKSSIFNQFGKFLMP